jgi:mono/diheme cytochrome c family protein
LSRFRIVPVLSGLFAIACALQVWTACNKKDANTDPKVLAGRGVYLANCIACHNMNPERDGSLGPAIKGSALDLLQARVLRAEYPPGYTPKRATKMMVKLPLMEADVENLHAFLNAATP